MSVIESYRDNLNRLFDAAMTRDREAMRTLGGRLADNMKVIGEQYGNELERLQVPVGFFDGFKQELQRFGFLTIGFAVMDIVEETLRS